MRFLAAFSLLLVSSLPAQGPSLPFGFVPQGGGGGEAPVVAIAFSTHNTSGLVDNHSITCAGGEDVPVWVLNNSASATGFTLTGTLNTSNIHSDGNFIQEGTISLQTFHISSCVAGTDTLVTTATGGTGGTTLNSYVGFTGLLNHTLNTAGTWKTNSGTTAFSCNGITTALSNEVVIAVTYATNSRTWSALTPSSFTAQSATTTSAYWAQSLTLASGSQTFSMTASSATTGYCELVAYK